MAEAFPEDENSFQCSVCLDPLKNPVTLSCGHSYCMGCISDCWDQQERKGKYSCPQCRQKFSSRPVLKKNVMLAELVEKLRLTGIQAAPLATPYAGPGDVACDFCPEKKLRAVKSCVVCQISLCGTHVQPHYDVPALKMHKLVKAAQLQKMICSQHGNPLQVFCRTDQKCICILCTMDDHKGHDTVSAAAERKEREDQLEDAKKQFNKRMRQRQKELQQLQKAVKCHKRSAQEALDDSERSFTELLQSIDKKRSQVKKVIRAQQRAELSRAEGIQERLKQDIEELSRGGAELEQLSREEDHVHFLQTLQALLGSQESKVYHSVTLCSDPSFDDVTESLRDLQPRVEKVCRKNRKKISGKAEKVMIALPMEPVTREDFLQHSRCLTFDPDYIDRHVSLSKRRRKVVCKHSSPDRVYRVLFDDTLSECCYWEAEWRSRDDSSLAVFVEWEKEETDSEDSESENTDEENDSDSNIAAADDDDGGDDDSGDDDSDDDDDDSDDDDDDDDNGSAEEKEGDNDDNDGSDDDDINESDNESEDDSDDDSDNDDTQCLMLHFGPDGCSFSNLQSGEDIELPTEPSSRIGVYVDHRAGILSFYNVSETMTLLHTVQTTFTGPVYAGFCLRPGTSVEILSGMPKP
ncbi:hypothetical protein ACEWY4_016322 [Coilia grayii]|uniref:E3 ubiquitin/ISG15 ligase TRIM25-like n=1 Tax=Coilia grayii TaxID=363190 RepID=A0ABD1JK93_9TELE